MSSEALLSSIIPFAWTPRICNGFCSEKGLEVDANYHRFLGRMFFFGVELLQRVCECGQLGLTTLNGMVFRTAIQ